MAGLEVKCVFSWDLSRVILKIRCSQDRLEEVAEKMHLKLKNREGAIRRFKVSNATVISLKLYWNCVVLCCVVLHYIVSSYVTLFHTLSSYIHHVMYFML